MPVGTLGKALSSPRKSFYHHKLWGEPSGWAEVRDYTAKMRPCLSALTGFPLCHVTGNAQLVFFSASYFTRGQVTKEWDTFHVTLERPASCWLRL